MADISEYDHLFDEYSVEPTEVSSEKSYTTAVVLSGIFGILGIHHFYLGRWLHGMFDLGLSISAFASFVADLPQLGFSLLMVDFIHTVYVTYKLLVGEYRDGKGDMVTYPGQKLK